MVHTPPNSPKRYNDDTVVDTAKGGHDQNAAVEAIGAENSPARAMDEEVIDTPPDSPGLMSPLSPNRHGFNITATPPRFPTGVQEKGASPRHEKGGDEVNVGHVIGLDKEDVTGARVEDASEARYGHETNLKVFVTEVTDDEGAATPPRSTTHASNHSSSHSIDDDRAPAPPEHRFVLGDDIAREHGGGANPVDNHFDRSIGLLGLGLYLL